MQTWHHVLRKSHSASMKSNTCEDEARFTVQVGRECTDDIRHFLTQTIVWRQFNGREPIIASCLTRYTFFATRDSLPYTVSLQNLPDIKLHDAFIDRIWHRRANVTSD